MVFVSIEPTSRSWEIALLFIYVKVTKNYNMHTGGRKYPSNQLLNIQNMMLSALEHTKTMTIPTKLKI